MTCGVVKVGAGAGRQLRRIRRNELLVSHMRHLWCHGLIWRVAHLLLWESIVGHAHRRSELVLILDV